jgi:putative two-component system response regulator
MATQVIVAEDDVSLNSTLEEVFNSEKVECELRTDPRDVLEYISQNDVKVLLADLKMPHMSGIELAQQVRNIKPDVRIIIMTAFSSVKTVIEALRLGVDSYILKPFSSEELLFRLKKSFEQFDLLKENSDYQDHLEEMIYDQTQKMLIKQRELRYSQIENIFAIGNIIEARDVYTRGHTERVTLFAVAMAEALGWSKQRIRELGIGSPLHDIGKIGIPDKILKKDGKLTFEEYENMKEHPQIGYEMIRLADFPKGSINSILYHHERYDGKGYPFGLAAEDIPEEGRVMAVCDAFDAMTSTRVYRPAMPVEKAVSILREGAGGQWDPACVELFLTMLEEGHFEFLDSDVNTHEMYYQLVIRLTDYE